MLGLTLWPLYVKLQNILNGHFCVTNWEYFVVLCFTENSLLHPVDINIQDKRHKATLTHYGEIYFVVSPPGAAAEVTITINGRNQESYLFEVQFFFFLRNVFIFWSTKFSRNRVDRVIELINVVSIELSHLTLYAICQSMCWKGTNITQLWGWASHQF